VVKRARQVLGRIEANSHVAVGLKRQPPPQSPQGEGSLAA
jgi:hypothetical protein